MNLLKTFFVFIFLFFSTQLWAQIESDVAYGSDENQPKDLFKAKQPQRGIYYNFNELKTNTPSGTSEFQENSVSGPVITYQIKGGEKNKRIKDAFGFSDGQSIYVNANTYGNGNYYVKVELVGRYLFFRDQGGSNIGLGGAIAIGPVAIGTGGGNSIKAYILDMENGTVETLNAKTLRLILSRDRELSQAFEQEKQRNNVGVLYEYIKRYNEKYPY